MTRLVKNSNQEFYHLFKYLVGRNEWPELVNAINAGFDRREESLHMIKFTTNKDYIKRLEKE